MSALKIAALVFAALSFLSGVAAAWYWWASAATSPTVRDDLPLGRADRDPNVMIAYLLHIYSTLFNISDASRSSSQLNRVAAILTGASALFAAIFATALDHWPSN
jgi:hypothetical protein